MEVDEKPSHVGRGRVSPRRLPEPARILEPARTRYAGSNDHHFCEKLCAVESLSSGCETLRRLLRSAGVASIFLSGVKKVIPPGARASDRFAWHAKQAKNTPQPTQRSSPRMPRRKPAGLVGFPDTGGRRAGALEEVPRRSR